MLLLVFLPPFFVMSLVKMYSANSSKQSLLLKSAFQLGKLQSVFNVRLFISVQLWKKGERKMFPLKCTQRCPFWLLSQLAYGIGVKHHGHCWCYINNNTSFLLMWFKHIKWLKNRSCFLFPLVHILVANSICITDSETRNWVKVTSDLQPTEIYSGLKQYIFFKKREIGML